MLLQCFSTIHSVYWHCSSTVPFWWAIFFFGLLFVLFFFFCIYCYTDTTNFTIFSQLLRCKAWMRIQCTSNVFARYIYSVILLSHFFFFFIVLNSSYSTKQHCSYSCYKFFFLSLPFVLFFSFYIYILLY